jgi:hypothetical protein
LLHSEHLRLKVLDSYVLLPVEEAQVGGLTLGLAQGALPAKLDLLECLLALNELHVESVVFLDEALVLVLQRQLGLCVEGRLLLEYRVLVLHLLEGLGCFQQFVQQPLN